MSFCAQSRDRLLARPESTVGGTQPRPTWGTVGVGGTGRGICERVQEVNIRKFRRKELLDINTARAACRTILRVRHEARQLEPLDIAYQCEIGVESQGFQGRGLPRADVTMASSSRPLAGGEWEDLWPGRNLADIAARAESPPDTRHIVTSYT